MSNYGLWKCKVCHRLGWTGTNGKHKCNGTNKRNNSDVWVEL